VSCTKADVPMICAEARERHMVASHAKQLAAAAAKATREANAAAAAEGPSLTPAGATPEPGLPPRPSTALRWAQSVAAGEIIPHSETGFDKVRLGFPQTRSQAKCRILQKHARAGNN
jgi:hypothetical protein